MKNMLLDDDSLDDDDFSEEDDEDLLDDDFFDEEGHMLGELADRYSDILASVLLDKCDKSTAFYGTYAQLELAVYENYVTKQ